MFSSLWQEIRVNWPVAEVYGDSNERQLCSEIAGCHDMLDILQNIPKYSYTDI